MTSPSSLRDLYSKQDSAWSFTAPAASLQSPINSSSSPTTAAAPTFKWSARPAPNSIFDLSPDLNEASGVSLVDIIRTMGASVILQYTSTAIAMPWEVGKLLLQVQWVPKEAHTISASTELVEDSDSSSEENDDTESFFADPEGSASAIPPSRSSQGRKSSVSLNNNLPEYIIPVGSVDGVWSMIKRVGRFRAEGWLALWKGLLTSCLTEIMSSTLQPIIHNVLRSLFLPATSLFQHPPMIIPIASHLVTGFILSPLDLIRTRLVVQSFINPSYTGPLDAFFRIYEEEGGLHGIYLHPQLLLPTIIDNALRPIISLALPTILVSYLGLHITEDSNPVAWGFVELAGSCMGLLLTLPFETVRRRLQVQVRGTAKPLNGCVQLRPTPYNGVVDALWHILTEERSDLPITAQQKKQRRSSKGKEREGTSSPDDGSDGWRRQSGIGQLYRGLGMRLSASIIVFLLSLISGEDDGGWAEL